jgi:hypothetical protein
MAGKKVRFQKLNKRAHDFSAAKSKLKTDKANHGSTAQGKDRKQVTAAKHELKKTTPKTKSKTATEKNADTT